MLLLVEKRNWDSSVILPARPGSRGPMLDAARYKKDTARMIAMYATPSGSDQEGAYAVSPDIAHGHSIKAEGVARDPASICTDEMSIFARVKVRTPSTNSGSGVLPGAHDEVGMAVPIDIARD